MANSLSIIGLGSLSPRVQIRRAAQSLCRFSPIMGTMYHTYYLPTYRVPVGRLDGALYGADDPPGAVETWMPMNL